MSDSIHRPTSRLTESENALFKLWKPRYSDGDHFVSDGAVDPDEYARAPRKVVFVLKEVNDEDGGDWDLRKMLRNSGDDDNWRWWNTVARWVEGIQSLPQVVPWREFPSLDSVQWRERRQEALRKIVAVNLKKKPGGPTANDAEIRKAAKKDRDLISEQLSLYAPDFVICCGDIVGTALTEDVHLLSGDVWTRTSRGVWFCRVNEVPYVCPYHPAARFPGHLVHYGLMDALEEVQPGQLANE